MKPIAIAGLILIVLGLAALVMGGIPYTSRETVIDIGPIHATAERERTLRVPTVIGVVAVVGGVAMLVFGGSRRS
jgi:membrane-bound ClpP family serine protease